MAEQGQREILQITFYFACGMEWKKSFVKKNIRLKE
jgi:hypothetical protein